MSLRFRNTLTGRSQPFEPLEPGHVRMYTCGPTVYAPAHVGNFRSFVFADVLRRTLLFSGLRVTWVMNITDVDDKIIRDAAAAGIPIEELTTRYTAVFLEDLARLGIATPDVMPRATDHIDDMVRLIETLIEKGPRLPDRGRLRVLPHRLVARLRAAGQARSSAAAQRRARRGRRVREGRRSRLRALEGGQARRAQLGRRRSVPAALVGTSNARP